MTPIQQLDSEFFKAVSMNDPESTFMLLEAGADVNYEDDSALKLACAIGNQDLVQILLEAGADVHSEDDDSLMISSRMGHTEVVKLLLDAGANIHANDNFAFFAASYYGHDDILQLLEDAKYKKQQSLNYSKARYYWEPYEDEECGICKELLIHDKIGGKYLGNPIKTGCNHKFHESCLLSWKQTGSGGKKCPICRGGDMYFGH